MPENDGFLRNAYVLETVDDTKNLYRDWAESYDHELRENGYATPRRCAEALAAHVDDRTAPILDIGCGTGLSGEALKDAGFTVVDGTDFSAEMLAAADKKRVYRALLQGDLNNPLPVEPGAYAHATGVGVFSPGHAPASAIVDTINILPSGGCLSFSLNDHALQEPEFKAVLNELLDCGVARLLFQEHGEHLPGIDLKSSVYVLQNT